MGELEAKGSYISGFVEAKRAKFVRRVCRRDWVKNGHDPDYAEMAIMTRISQTPTARCAVA